MPSQLLVDYLNRSNASFQLQHHPVAYTAAEVAQAAHVQGAHFAKVVMVKIGEELAMVVIPAHYHLELDLLQDSFEGRPLRLAEEREFRHRFPRCETGAMPPFGHLYGVVTYVVALFDEDSDIAFNAGTHTEIIRMGFREFLRLSHAEVLENGALPPLGSTARAMRKRVRL